jgi:hypothetical protein
MHRVPVVPGRLGQLKVAYAHVLATKHNVSVTNSATALIPLTPVEPVRDWLDYAVGFSGVVGALLAALAIAYAARSAAQSKRDLIRERRLVFELGLLAEIRRQIGFTQFAHLSGYVGALIRDANDETDLPVLRTAIGTKGGPIGHNLTSNIVGDRPRGSSEAQQLLLARATQEVDEAIDRRLEGA